MNVVIIGGVAAGLKTAAKLRRCNKDAKITVIEKGEIISYGACGMPYYVAGEVEKIESLMSTPNGSLRNPGFFKNVKDVDVWTKTVVTKIDRNKKEVLVQDLTTQEEKSVPYDKLVIATGASPIKPPLPGSDLPGVQSLWHPDDAVAVKKALELGKIKNAVIVGAGLVGMEMAEAFRAWKANVTVIEMKDHVFPAFLDEEMAAPVEKYLRSQGVELLLGEKVLEFVGTDRVEQVKTDKRVIDADVVILSIGVKPNVMLARQAGLEMGETGAIAVNEFMQTSDPDIYAGGDCAETTNMVTGKKVFAPMGSTANKQGRVIGENLCGGQVKFKGVLNIVIVKVMDLSVGKTGLSEREAKALGYEYVTAMVANPDRPHYMKAAKPISVKLIVEAKTHKLLGVQSFGMGNVDKALSVASAVLTLGGTFEDLADIDLPYAPPFSSPIDNVAVAAHAVLNKLSGQLKSITSLEAKEKMNQQDTVFLDVRAQEECFEVHLKDCCNIEYIPLGQLRKRVSELDSEKEIIAFCKISLRGYEASLILKGEGFENVKVMEGGIMAWPFACECQCEPKK